MAYNIPEIKILSKGGGNIFVPTPFSAFISVPSARLCSGADHRRREVEGPKPIGLCIDDGESQPSAAQ